MPNSKEFKRKEDLKKSIQKPMTKEERMLFEEMCAARDMGCPGWRNHAHKPGYSTCCNIS